VVKKFHCRRLPPKTKNGISLNALQNVSHACKSAETGMATIVLIQKQLLYFFEIFFDILSEMVMQ